MDFASGCVGMSLDDWERTQPPVSDLESFTALSLLSKLKSTAALSDVLYNVPTSPDAFTLERDAVYKKVSFRYCISHA